MKELRRMRQSRRDFYADYKCGHCGYIKENVSGYDDTYFNVTVVGDMKCPKCGKTEKQTEDNTVIPQHIVI